MLSIFIPSWLTMDTADKKIKTYKVAQVARAASIFRVDNILIYKDRRKDESTFIEKVLGYAETPQYLRRVIFPLDDDLRFAGVIPPLRTPHHPLHRKSEELKRDEIREGVITSIKRDRDGFYAELEIGVEKPAVLRLDNSERKHMRKGKRVTVAVTSNDPLEVELRRTVSTYWGYKVKSVGSLGKELKRISETKIIFTSRKGLTYRLEELREVFSGENIAFIFGSPERGVDEILRDEGLSYDDFAEAHVLNLIPDQGTETVRVEEAIFCSLSIWNYLYSDHAGFYI